MKKFKFMDPSTIMAVIMALVILAVGVFAFWVTIANIPTTDGIQAQFESINNASDKATSVFNIIGVVLIIGAIMTIVGLVMSYVKPGAY